MIQTYLFISKKNSQVEKITALLAELQSTHPHELHIVDIDSDPVLQEEYGDKAPVMDIGVYRLVRSFDRNEVEFAFTKAEERLQDAQSKGNAVLVQRITQPLAMTKSDRFSHWFSNHYMVILNIFTFIYVFFSFLAPGLMKIGWELPARTLYRIYSPLCHQLAFRSFFLFGEQLYYPRELAGMEGVMTYGQATGFDEDDIPTARRFIGNETMGYKMTLCERDVAIYGAIFLFGLAFTLGGRKFNPLPWYLWILIGLGPIGLDGFSQLLSQTGLGIFAWIPLRESTPLLRVVTGALFGMGTAWFGFPYLEESVLDNRREMHIKHAIVSQINDNSEV